MSVGNKWRLVVCGGLATAIFVVNSGDAIARPRYLSVFKATYLDVVLKNPNDVTCAICHPGKNRKEHNNYGVAVFGKLSEKNEVAEVRIRETLLRAEDEKSDVYGKTFGDLLKAGVIPATNDVGGPTSELAVNARKAYRDKIEHTLAAYEQELTVAKKSAKDVYVEQLQVAFNQAFQAKNLEDANEFDTAIKSMINGDSLSPSSYSAIVQAKGTYEASVKAVHDKYEKLKAGLCLDYAVSLQAAMDAAFLAKDLDEVNRIKKVIVQFQPKPEGIEIVLKPIPTDGSAATAGSFTVFLPPLNPRYSGISIPRIIIDIRLPDNVTTFNVNDLSGEIRRFGYKQPRTKNQGAPPLPRVGRYFGEQLLPFDPGRNARAICYVIEPRVTETYYGLRPPMAIWIDQSSKIQVKDHRVQIGILSVHALEDFGNELIKIKSKLLDEEQELTLDVGNPARKNRK